MPEILLHYIWQKGLFPPFDQRLTDGQRIEVIQKGEHNADAGPDFTNVRIRFFEDDGKGYYDLVGNVEIHVFSSDWYKHKHHQDRAYDNIILHVVRQVDKRVFNSQGEEVPQCELHYSLDKDYLSSLVHDAYLMDSALFKHLCGKHLVESPNLLTYGWRVSLCKSRLTCKKKSIDQLLEITDNNWQEAFYITLAHNFGFHTNSIPFEQLAIQTPLSVLQNHRSNIFQTVAILLGQAGLLSVESEVLRGLFEDSVLHLLFNEYRKWQNIYGLKPLGEHLWKRARIHPNNFPEIRVIQFARLLEPTEDLLERIVVSADIGQVQSLFEEVSLPDTSGFSQFLSTVPRMGKEGIRTLLINTAIPYKYARGQEETALRWLHELPSENNSIVRQWKLLGQAVSNAADSQALIHLYMTYCMPQQCLQCDVAYQIFLQKEERQKLQKTV